jgi:hypothetical protein
VELDGYGQLSSTYTVQSRNSTIAQFGQTYNFTNYDNIYTRFNLEGTLAPVPEPSSLLLGSLSAAALACRRRRSRSALRLEKSQS